MSSAALSYEGLDGVVRRCRLLFAPRPDELTEADALFQVSLPPRAEATFYLTVACERGGVAPPVLSYDQGVGRATAALEGAEAARRGGHRMDAHLQPGNVPFFEWLGWQRVGGLAPYAGIPHQRMMIDLTTVPR